MKRLARLAALAAALAAASCGGCDKKGDEPGATRQAEAPVPAPDGLLADLVVGAPNGTWMRLQRGVGGAIGILPAEVGGLVAIGLGLDPAFAREIDGAAPAFGVLAGDPAEPGWAFALKLVDLRRARGVLADGDAARFTAREAGGLTELVPKGNAPPQGTTFGVSRGGYLLVARTPADLARLGPYASRTLPSRALPGEGSVVVDVPRASIEARIKPKLDTLWEGAKTYLLAQDERSRREHGGRAPDYADPQAIVSALDALVSKRLALVGDLERVRVVFDVGEDAALLVATMIPRGDGGPAAKWIGGMRTGDAADVLAMPAVSAIALTTRDAEGDRQEQAREVERAVTISLGARLAEADAKRLHEIVEDWTRARGETIGLAALWDEPRGMFLRGAVRDGDAAGRAVKGLLDLARVSPFKDALRVREVATTIDDAPPLGKVQVATITRDTRDAGKPRRSSRGAGSKTADAGAPRDEARSTLGLAWVVEGGALDVSTGPEPVFTLRHGAKPDKKLADEPAVVKALEPLGATASTIVVAQPLRFDPTRANLPTAPLVLGVGRKDKEAFVRVDVSSGVLRELARLLMMF